MHAARHLAPWALAVTALAGCAAASGERRSVTVAATRTTATVAPRSATTPAWSKPATLASAVDIDSRSAIAFTGDGHGVATAAGTVAGETRVLISEPGSRSFAQAAQGLLLTAPATYGRDGVAFVRAPAPAAPPLRSKWPPAPAKWTELGVSLGTVRALGDLRVLARVRAAPGDVQAALAGNSRGDVAVAWVQPQGGRSVLRLATRRSGRAFGSPMTFATAGSLFGLKLAYGDGGDLVVAFARYLDRRRGFDVAARVIRAGGRAGPIQSLGPARRSTSVAAVVAPTGDAVVAWGSQDATYEDVTTAWSVRAALLSTHAVRFAPAQMLDPGDDVARSVAVVSAAMAGDGTATVAWSGAKRAAGQPLSAYTRPYPCPVRVATSSRYRRFGPARQLARNGSALGVVSARDGATTVLWGLFAEPDEPDDYVESLDQMLVSRRPAGADAFAPAHAVSVRQATVNRGAIALDPRSQRPSAVWHATPGVDAEEGLYDTFEVEVLYAAQR